MKHNLYYKLLTTPDHLLRENVCCPKDRILIKIKRRYQNQIQIAAAISKFEEFYIMNIST